MADDFRAAIGNDAGSTWSLSPADDPSARPAHDGAAPAADPTVDPSEALTGAGPPIAPPGYELLDAIGSGGMGVIYRALELALKRHVAVKILHGRFPSDSPVAARFVEEAQITGQLQHPGIPPVHRVGTLADGRPFLVMKLIKGRTLEELLKERKDPAQDRGRFIAVFEQVCQAVACAHEHKVIHRDLKPANVMVGKFGEVQVMDWGLAKLLGDFAARIEVEPEPEPTGATVIRTIRDSEGSFTQAGSVLGTPAFMPPEQAGGEIGKIDERADVFGLGAILCVILTGKPPFVAKDAEVVRLMAIRGQLADCFARLDWCGAEPELVALAKQCLAADPADRARDAGELARVVAGLRAAADERARQAAVEKVRAEGELRAAEVRAAEQKKRRRVQAALGLAFTALVVLGGAFAWWQDRQAADRRAEQGRVEGERAARQSRTAAAVFEALADARQRIAESWSLADFPDRMQTATDAVAAAVRRAQGFVDSGDPTPDLLAELAAVRAAASELERHTALICDCARSQRRFASQQLGGGDAGNRAAATASIERDREALRRFGLDPLNGPEDEVARAVADSRLRDSLLGILLRWQYHSPDPDTKQRLGQVIRATRRVCGGAYARWQDLLDRNDVPGLVAFGASPDALALNSKLVSALGRDLSGYNQPDAGRTLLRAAVDRYPHDVWLHFDLALACMASQPPELQEALSHYSAASVQQPDSSFFLHYVGGMYNRLGALDQAEAAYRKGIALSPTAAVLHRALGDVLDRKRNPDGAIASYREALRLDPNFTEAHVRLGMVLARSGDPDGAVAEFNEVIRLAPNHAPAHNGLAWILAAGPDGVRNGKSAVEHATRACELTEWRNPDYIDILAAAHAEIGDFDKAIEYQKRALSLPGYEEQHGALWRVKVEQFTRKQPYRDPALARR